MHDDVGRRLGDRQRHACLQLTIGADLGSEHDDPAANLGDAARDPLELEARAGYNDRQSGHPYPRVPLSLNPPRECVGWV
jgi:hypothetical protein